MRTASLSGGNYLVGPKTQTEVGRCILPGGKEFVLVGDKLKARFDPLVEICVLTKAVREGRRHGSTVPAIELVAISACQVRQIVFGNEGATNALWSKSDTPFRFFPSAARLFQRILGR